MFDTAANVPASVAVAFPRADDGTLSAPLSFHLVTVTLAGLALAEYAGEAGHSGGPYLLHSTAVANFTGGGSPVNDAELTDLAEQIATDFYLWRLASLEVRYESVVPWVADALHDIEWTHGAGIATAVHRSEWEPEFGQLKHAGAFGSSDVPQPCDGGCPDPDSIGGMKEWTLDGFGILGGGDGLEKNFSWTSPPCVLTDVLIEAIGTGGWAGGDLKGGGGGGEYRSSVRTLQANSYVLIDLSYLSSKVEFSVLVNPDDPGLTPETVEAFAGQPANSLGTPALGGTGGTGDVGFPGGNGSSPSGNSGGGGGGSGWPSAAGSNGTALHGGAGLGKGGEAGTYLTEVQIDGSTEHLIMLPATGETVDLQVVDSSAIAGFTAVGSMEGIFDSTGGPYPGHSAFISCHLVAIIDATHVTIFVDDDNGGYDGFGDFFTNGFFKDPLVPFQPQSGVLDDPMIGGSPGGGGGGAANVANSPEGVLAGVYFPASYFSPGGDALVRITWGRGVTALNGKTGSISLRGDGLPVTNEINGVITIGTNTFRGHGAPDGAVGTAPAIYVDVDTGNLYWK